MQAPMNLQAYPKRYTFSKNSRLSWPLAPRSQRCKAILCLVKEPHLQGAVDVKPGKSLDRDVEKEAARKYRRVTFDHAQWAAHRSTKRYFRHTKGLLTSRIVRGLWAPLLYVCTISLLVCSYETALLEGTLPDLGFTWPQLAIEIAGPFSLSTFALSLLLVFRTNSSYQRFNDARKLWGSAINRSRDIARQTTQWISPAEPELAKALCRWTVAFPMALMASLREDVQLEQWLQTVLEPDEAALVLQQQHPASAVLQAMGMCVRASAAKDVEKLRIDESISALQDVMGGCERIFRTPIPLSYTRHTGRFLMCWLTLLPFCVADTMGWATVGVATGMAFFLLGIEEIGVQIEEPFGILALEAFCATIAKNVDQAQAAADAMMLTAAKHSTAALPPGAQPLPVLTAADGNGNGSSSSSGSSSASERLSGGYTLPRPPAAVNNVLVDDELLLREQFADSKIGIHSASASDSDSGSF